LHLALFLIVSIYWGCSAPLTKLLGVPEHLQPPPCYAYGIIGATRLYAAAFGSVTPLLQLESLDHFKLV